MIQANELRIGNFITCENASGVIKVFYHHIRYAQIYKDNNYTPIPLTPEWLERCGFTVEKFNGEDACLIHSGKKLFASYFKRSKTLSVDVIYPRKLKFLHELQNLYFALTGEELKVKEPNEIQI